MVSYVWLVVWLLAHTTYSAGFHVTKKRLASEVHETINCSTVLDAKTVAYYSQTICQPFKNCGRHVIDGLFSTDDIVRLKDIALKGFHTRNISSGHASLDLTTGNTIPPAAPCLTQLYVFHL
jgi:hypothetical protein